MSKCMNGVHAYHRIILSGTPLQNNLMEIWSLMDWLCDHRLLGEKSDFKKMFKQPIEKGQDKRADESTRLYADAVTKELHKLVSSVMLRREKTAVFKDAAIPRISKKTEIVLWW